MKLFPVMSYSKLLTVFYSFHFSWMPCSFETCLNQVIVFLEFLHDKNYISPGGTSEFQRWLGGEWPKTGENHWPSSYQDLVIYTHLLISCDVPWTYLLLCCCLPTPMTLDSGGGGNPIFPLVVHHLSSPSIWPAVKSLRQGLSKNPGVTLWCVCGCSWRDDVCECYSGGILVMNVIWRRLCVNMIWGRAIYLF